MPGTRGSFSILSVHAWNKHRGAELKVLGWRGGLTMEANLDATTLLFTNLNATQFAVNLEGFRGKLTWACF